MNNSIVYPRRRKKTFISERSLFSPLVFNNAYLHSGIITPFVHRFVSEYVLDRAHETMDDLNIQYTDIIFLHTAAPVCYERVRQRHRSCEVNNITLDYLYVLEREYARHMDWWQEKLGPDHVFKINSTAKSPAELTEEFKALSGLGLSGEG